MAEFTWVTPASPGSPPPNVPPASSSVAEPGDMLFGNLDQEIDPETLDYVDTPDGAWAETSTSRTAAMCQLSIRYNSWHADPDAGTRIYEWIESGDPVTREMIIDDTRRAMQLLVEDGLITDLRVDIEDDAFNVEDGRCEVQIFYTDVMSGHPVELVYSPF